MRVVKDGNLWIYTYKSGLLSPVLHDLRLELKRFVVETDGRIVHADLDLTSLVVEGAVVQGALAENLLSAEQKREILQNIRHKVLKLDRFPQSSFRGQVEGPGINLSDSTQREFSVPGTLELVGKSHRIALSVSLSRVSAEPGTMKARGMVTLTPSVFGISPFRALMGAIRLKDQVDVRFELSLRQDPANKPPE